MTHHALAFVDAHTDLAGRLIGSYDPLLVALSVAIAVAMGFAALLIAARVQGAAAWPARGIWLGLGACVMASGIWAMHFLGMLALVLPIPVHYALSTTLASLVPALLASGAALLSLGRSQSFWRLNAAGSLIAAGIGSMHYAGMAAMVLDARMLYEPRLFAASLAVAHVLATAALYVSVVLGARWKEHRLRARALGGGVLGGAVAGMHYTGMAAAVYLPQPGASAAALAHAIDASGLELWVAAMSVLVLSAAAVAALVDERLSRMSGALSAEQELSRQVIDGVGEAIVVIDAQGAIQRFNRAAGAMFGYAAQEAIGRDVGCLMPESIAAHHAEYVRRYVETRRSCAIGARRELVARRRDGSEFPISLIVSELSVNGELMFTSVIQDLTQQRLLEAKAVQSQKLESIGRLAAGVAHEINTPAQYVADNLEFLAQSIGSLYELSKPFEALRDAAKRGSVPDALLAEIDQARARADVDYLEQEIPQALAEAREGIARITGIVRAMREFSHPGSEAKKPVDLNRAIASTITVARHEWQYVAEVETDFDPDLPFVPCHAAELNQVFLNLIVNAAQAIAEQKRGEKGRIRVSTRRDGSFVRVDVRDDGPGIPPEMAPRVFDPFFTTKAVGKGTGQGLAIARSAVVDKHGGTLDVDSRKGEGACFSVRLPLEAAEEASP